MSVKVDTILAIFHNYRQYFTTHIDQIHKMEAVAGFKPLPKSEVFNSSSTKLCLPLLYNVQKCYILPTLLIYNKLQSNHL